MSELSSSILYILEHRCAKYGLKLLVMDLMIKYTNVLGEFFGFCSYCFFFFNPTVKLAWGHYFCTSEMNIIGGLTIPFSFAFSSQKLLQWLNIQRNFNEYEQHMQKGRVQ